MSLTNDSLGDLFQRIYNTQDITKALNAAMPVFQMLHERAETTQMSPEWSVVRETTWHDGQHFIVKYMHHCPTGDVRVISGKTCHLCKAEVPGWVELMVRCLEDPE